MQILRIDLNQKKEKYEDLPERFLTIGGRGFIARILNEEVPARCYPLGPENKLIICNGPLAGANISSAGRISVGAKSPLTEGIKESNSGGVVGEALAKLGLRALILEGIITEDMWYLIKIDEGSIEFIPANEFLGLGNYKFKEKMDEQYGKDYCYVTIGQAGEKKYLNSGLAMTDMYGRQSRMAARGGLGAVLGSKKIKGILISNKGSYKHPRISSAEFIEARKAYHKVVTDSDRIKVLREYGTASTIMAAQELGALPTYNFSKGQFNEAEKISGEEIHDLIINRGGDGKNSEPCMNGCIIQCSNCYPDENGKEIVAPLEYETLGMCGSNLGIGDLDSIAKINYLCNDYGLDTIETGGALGVIAEAGLVEFGDVEGFISIIDEVANDGWLGRLVGMGTGLTAKMLNVRRAPVVKNQCLSAYDPRSVKGTGVTYATTPMGADHTAGLTIFMPMNHRDKKDQIKVSRMIQLGRAGYDVLGLCCFLMSATGTAPDKIVDMLNTLYGVELEPSYINEIGKSTISLEIKYNRAAGLDEKYDRIPDYFKEEILPPFDSKWDIEDEEIDSIFADLTTNVLK